MTNCKYCGKPLLKKTLWQKSCNDPECQKKRQEDKYSRWYRKNKQKRIEYFKAYREL